MVKILHMILPVWILVLNALVQSHTMYKNKSVPHFVNNAVWVAVMCQCRLINFNKCMMVEDTDNRGSYACMGAG